MSSSVETETHSLSSSVTASTPPTPSTEMPSSSALNSTVTVSLTSILMKPVRTASSSSLPGSSSKISFAPLPPIPRKKRNNTLGVSGRANLLRQRSLPRMRLCTDDNCDCQFKAEYITSQEEYDAQAEYYASRRRALQEEDEALEHLGRMIKDAGRSLWRKMSKKSSSAKISVDNNAPKDEQPPNNEVDTKAVKEETTVPSLEKGVKEDIQGGKREGGG